MLSTLILKQEKSSCVISMNHLLPQDNSRIEWQQSQQGNWDSKSHVLIESNANLSPYKIGQQKIDKVFELRHGKKEINKKKRPGRSLGVSLPEIKIKRKFE